MFENKPYVARVIRDNRIVIIVWTLGTQAHTTYLYHHTDGSWGADPDFLAESLSTRRAVLAKANMLEAKKRRQAAGKEANADVDRTSSFRSFS